MNSFYIIRGPLCRPLITRPSHILKRYKFSGRIKPAEKPSTGLPTTPARTRFAPSPTGYVHIGSLRTALYNYLLAKATGGQFLLRVEDTDRSRIVPDAEKRLFEDLKWAGLSWDEGPDVGGPFGPYKQSERLELYNKYASQLLDEGRAYRCFCTPEELDQMRSISIQEGSPTIYNGTCSHIPPDVAARRAANGEPHCVRFKIGGQRPLVNDLVYGRYTKPDPEDDFIIIKRDGYPTYHFANVVDDHLMEITHVVRGAEWLVSTPRHIALYEAFGWQTPQFAHVGLLVNQEKQKLSKRHGDVDIASWRDRGILPIALLNYVLLLGWSMGRGVKGRHEAMDLDEMVSNFTLGFTKGNVIVNNKHEYMQRFHVKRLAEAHGPEHISNIVLPAIVAGVQKYEEARKGRGDAADAQLSEIAPQLGPLVPLAQDAGAATGGVSAAYLDGILKLDVHQYLDVETYLSRNRYLIWQIPGDRYRAGYRDLMWDVTQLFTVEGVQEVQGQGQGQGPEPEQLPRHAQRVSDITATLRDILQGIEEARWNKEGLGEAVVPFVKSVYATTVLLGPEHLLRRGYPVLRWIVTAGNPGLSAIQGMAVLGKEETMRRAEKAYEVAKSIESES